MGREFLPRTEPYRQTKLYATVSVNHFDYSFPEINFCITSLALQMDPANPNPNSTVNGCHENESPNS